MIENLDEGNEVDEGDEGKSDDSGEDDDAAEDEALRYLIKYDNLLTPGPLRTLDQYQNKRPNGDGGL